MENIIFDRSNANQFVDEEFFREMKLKAIGANKKIDERSGVGSEMLGWLDLPEVFNKEEFERVLDAAKRIRSNSDALVVIGIGGSYLGPRAVIEALSPNFGDIESGGRSVKIYFAGNNLSGTYLNDLMKIILDKDISVNVISKSGTTTEPALAFRVLKKFMEDKYGEDGARERIFVTTDKQKGALKTLAEKEGYETFVIPDNIGGRYSVLTPVGLLPIAVSGVDINELVDGAKSGMIEYSGDDNAVIDYAAIRNCLYQNNKKIEMLVSYEPNLHYLAEWWKQLFGESEGKEGKGIFPASANFSTDLHSLGQYIQEGERHLWETVLNVEKPAKDTVIEPLEDDIDGFDFLAGKGLNFVNQNAFRATVAAHVEGGVPNLIINLPELTAFNLGKLIYFFEKACAVSGYILQVNPFDQPGVELYKKNMFKLLGRES